jgi:hypothetical protein
MTTPTDLLKRSRDKYALGQARLRREAAELALLSFQGSLEDALRANLLLHALPAAGGEWDEVLTALRSSSGDPSLGPPLLITGEAERLRRMHSLCDRIRSGGQVTVSLDTIADYQQFIGRLLQRYGVLIGQPDAEEDSPLPDSRRIREPPPDKRFKLLDQLPAFAVPVLLVLLMLAAGAGAAVMIQGGQSAPARPTAAVAVVVPTMPETVIIPPLTPGAPMPSVTPIPSPTTAPPGALALGRTAYVRSDVAGGLALREQPGIAAGNIVRVYLDPGTAVMVIGGPSEADGYQWWLVRAANIDGWCAGEFLEIR